MRISLRSAYPFFALVYEVFWGFFESGRKKTFDFRASVSLPPRRGKKKKKKLPPNSLSLSPLTLSSSCAGVSPTRAIPRPCLRALTAAVAKREGGHAAESRARPAEEETEEEQQEQEEKGQQGAAASLPTAATETATEAAAASCCSGAQQGAPPPTAAAIAQSSHVRGNRLKTKRRARRTVEGSPWRRLGVAFFFSLSLSGNKR